LRNDSDRLSVFAGREQSGPQYELIEHNGAPSAAVQIIVRAMSGK